MESHEADDHCGVPSSLVDDDTLMEGRASTGVDLSQVHRNINNPLLYIIDVKSG